MQTLVENNVDIELFRNFEIPKNQVPQVIKEYIDKVKSLGFNSMGILAEQRTKSVIASKVYHKLSTKEVKKINRLFPKQYIHGKYVRQEDSLSNYQFDLIPLGVLEEYRIAKESELFDQIKIRTPEKVISDPVLIGVIGNDNFLIARWGEALQSIDKLYAKYKTKMTLACLPALLVFLSPIITAIISFDFSYMLFLIMSVPISLGIAIATAHLLDV